MRRILTLLATLLLALPLSAQVDIVSPWRGPVMDLGRGLAWGVSGQGGINNAFILSNNVPMLGTCTTIRNYNAGNAKLLSIAAYQTADQRAIGYYASPATWTPMPLVYPLFSLGRPWVPAAGDARGPVSFYIPATAAARVAIVISDSVVNAGNDRADIYAIQSSMANCGAFVQGSYNFVYYSATINSNSTLQLFGRVVGSVWPIDPSIFRACTFDASIINTAGAAPTLNLYLQDLDLSVGNFVNDRVSFIQAAGVAATSIQQASLNLEASVVPAVTTDATLAAGSEKAGMFSDGVRLKWAITAGAVYTLSFAAHCH